MSFGFPRSRRLLLPKQYQSVFKKGRRTHLPHFIFIHYQTDHSHPRLGLAIAKKAVPKAVDRNRIKRIVRNSFRQCQHNIKANDIVVLSKRGAAAQSSAALQKQAQQFWQQLKPDQP